MSRSPPFARSGTATSAPSGSASCSRPVAAGATRRVELAGAAPLRRLGVSTRCGLACPRPGFFHLRAGGRRAGRPLRTPPHPAGDAERLTGARRGAQPIDLSGAHPGLVGGAPGVSQQRGLELRPARSSRGRLAGPGTANASAFRRLSNRLHAFQEGNPIYAYADGLGLSPATARYPRATEGFSHFASRYWYWNVPPPNPAARRFKPPPACATPIRAICASRSTTGSSVDPLEYRQLARLGRSVGVASRPHLCYDERTFIRLGRAIDVIQGCARRREGLSVMLSRTTPCSCNRLAEDA